MSYRKNIADFLLPQRVQNYFGVAKTQALSRNLQNKEHIYFFITLTSQLQIALVISSDSLWLYTSISLSLGKKQITRKYLWKDV